MRYPIIAGIDGTEASHDAIDWAADEARLRRVPLRLLHAWLGEMLYAPAGWEVERTRDAGAEALRAAAERAGARHSELEITTDLVDGYARDSLVTASEDADLLVLGTRGSGGFSRLLVGSTSLHVSSHALCPVVMVHPSERRAAEARAAEGGVLVGVDSEQHSAGVLEFALAAAERRHWPLKAVYAWSNPRPDSSGPEFPSTYREDQLADAHERRLLEMLADARRRHPGVEVTGTVERAGAAQLLVALSEVHQLVVVGRHGTVRGPMRRLGSVSQAVVQHAHCPVAVVPVD
ncbi:universal stress protein [Kitasatospora griseola]|uniref:universal stress protein n=1 Tax=Kitasatospora griseola TaxID=2064 RepID=UPI00380D5C69